MTSVVCSGTEFCVHVFYRAGNFLGQLVCVMRVRKMKRRVSDVSIKKRDLPFAAARCGGVIYADERSVFIINEFNVSPTFGQILFDLFYCHSKRNLCSAECDGRRLLLPLRLRVEDEDNSNRPSRR